MISREDLSVLLKNKTAPLLVDVRTPEEYERGAIPTAINIPHEVIDDRMLVEAPDKDTPMILYCKTGRRTQIAFDTLIQQGYTHVQQYKGGYKEWSQHLA